MGWETLALYAFGALTVIGIVIVGYRMLRREARRGGADSEAMERLEEMAKRQKRGEDVASGPLPLGLADQLYWMRWLREKAHRRQSKALPDDE